MVKVGTWNARGLRQPDKVHQVIRLMSEHQLDALCLQETWLSAETLAFLKE